MISELRKRNDEILKKLTYKDDEEYIKHMMITNILSDENWFMKINASDAYNILLDLGYDMDNALLVYNNLLRSNAN